MFIQHLHHKQDMTQDEFLSGVQVVWIQYFLFPKLVAMPKKKSPVFFTIYP